MKLILSFFILLAFNVEGQTMKIYPRKVPPTSFSYVVTDSGAVSNPLVRLGAFTKDGTKFFDIYDSEKLVCYQHGDSTMVIIDSAAAIKVMSKAFWIIYNSSKNTW